MALALAVFALASSGCATLDVQRTALNVTGQGIGSILGYALNQVCNLVVGAALGGRIEPTVEGIGPEFGFSELSPSQQRGVSLAGNVCTGVVAEYVVDAGLHRRSSVARGMASFHSARAFGYSFSQNASADYWRDFDGSGGTWENLGAAHASRIGAQLAGEDVSDDERSWWRSPLLGPSEDLEESYSEWEDLSPRLAQTDAVAELELPINDPFRARYGQSWRLTAVPKLSLAPARRARVAEPSALYQSLPLAQRETSADW